MNKGFVVYDSKGRAYSEEEFAAVYAEIQARGAGSQQPEARGVVDVEAIRRACQSGKRFWQSGPGYYEEIESLLPALTEARNG